MAHIMDETDGMIKVLCDETTGRVIGAFIIGPDACELGGIFTIAIQSAMTKQELQKILFAHPSLSESISEAMQ
jgi:dihydrolipoamide dehydrogenase